MMVLVNDSPVAVAEAMRAHIREYGMDSAPPEVFFRLQKEYPRESPAPEKAFAAGFAVIRTGHAS